MSYTYPGITFSPLPSFQVNGENKELGLVWRGRNTRAVRLYTARHLAAYIKAHTLPIMQTLMPRVTGRTAASLFVKRIGPYRIQVASSVKVAHYAGFIKWKGGKDRKPKPLGAGNVKEYIQSFIRGSTTLQSVGRSFAVSAVNIEVSKIKARARLLRLIGIGSKKSGDRDLTAKERQEIEREEKKQAKERRRAAGRFSVKVVAFIFAFFAIVVQDALAASEFDA